MTGEVNSVQNGAGGSRAQCGAASSREESPDEIHRAVRVPASQNAAKAIDFYGKAFGAAEKFRLSEPSGRIGHAELDFGGATLMLSEEFPEYGIHWARDRGWHFDVDPSACRRRRRGDPACGGRGGTVLREP